MAPDFKAISEEGERWKLVIGCPGYYVSNHGRVASTRGVRIRIMRQKTSVWGYKRITLVCSNRKRKDFHVHTLVAMAFCMNPNHYDEVNHIDEDKTNNHADNLEWCTRKYNQNYGIQGKKLASYVTDNRSGRPVVQVETGTTYRSLGEAARCSGVCASWICAAARKGVRAAGYHWRYA